MPANDSITTWLGKLRTGDSEAAERIWGRYFTRLVLLARKKLGGKRLHAADEEDVAIAVLDVFYRKTRAGQFPQLADRNELWRVLVVMTAKKSLAKRREERRQKRDPRRGLGRAAGSDADCFDVPALDVASAANTFSGNVVAGGGTLQVAGGTLPANNEYVGGPGGAAVYQMAGVNNVTASPLSAFILGYNPGQSGFYNLSGGQLSTVTEDIGYQAGGNFTHSTGTNSVSTSLSVGTFSFGSYTQGGGLLTAANEIVGDGGEGAFTQTAGSNPASSALTVGLNNADTTFSGSLSDSGAPSGSGGSLAKVGTGTLLLSGTNTYGGGTFVLDGTLVVTNNEALADGSSLSVGSDLGAFDAVVPAEVAAQPPAPVPEPRTLVLMIAAAAYMWSIRSRYVKNPAAAKC